MAALTAGRDAHEELVVAHERVVKSASQIWVGGLVGLNTSGTTQPLAKAVSGGLICLGVALESKLGVADGSVRCKTKEGIFRFHNHGSDTVTDQYIGKPVYADDDHTVATVATGSRPLAGYCMGVEDGYVRVWVGPRALFLDTDT